MSDADATPNIDGARDARVLDAVFQTIAARAAEAANTCARSGKPPKKPSRTTALLQKGVPKIAQKLGEEATEVVIEAVRGDHAMLVEESGDLLYFLLVLWQAAGVTPAQVWAELDKRHGMAEGDERAMRKASKARATATPGPDNPATQERPKP